MDASVLKGSDLVSCTTFASSDDGASVTHAAARRSSLASDEADDGQVAVVVCFEPLGSLFLCLTADLTNHDDTLSLGIVNELSEHVNEVCSVKRITADTDDSGLAKALGRGLIDSLVGQSTRAGDDTDLALGVDVTRHDSNLALARLNNARAVGSNESSLVL